jgi:hypothetical protein
MRLRVKERKELKSRKEHSENEYHQRNNSIDYTGTKRASEVRLIQTDIMKTFMVMGDAHREKSQELSLSHSNSEDTLRHSDTYENQQSDIDPTALDKADIAKFTASERAETAKYTLLSEPVSPDDSPVPVSVRPFMSSETFDESEKLESKHDSSEQLIGESIDITTINNTKTNH